MKVGVVGNARYPDLAPLLRRLAAEAPGRGITLFTEPDLAEAWPEGVPALDPARVDALLTLGGDGTLLRGARILGGRAIPILGVNLGQVGFLTTGHLGALETSLDALASGRYATERRRMLEATILPARGSPGTPQLALNDIVVHKGGVARVVRLAVTIDGEAVGPYSADGIIVATPTGSTAYSLSAGGPIVVPEVEAIVITAICAHTLAVRPLVIPAGSHIVIRPIPPWTENLLVSVDGQLATTLEEDGRVEIRTAEAPVLLVRLEGDGYLRRVREKLQWGDLSHRRASP